MRVGVFTIASKNYLAYVRVLMASVARVHPEYERFLCLADRLDGYVEAANEGYTIVEAEQIRIPDFDRLSIRYDIMEMNTAVKPYMFDWLFENTDLDAVIYLDPDIRVYSRLDELEARLGEGASVVLTPHITSPLEDGKMPSDYHMLQSGVFNLGFVAATRCKESLSYMKWWGRRLAKECVADIQRNLFVDQKWCDLAPCFLEDLSVLRHTSYNVAYWNLAHRKVSKNVQGAWEVNGQPLKFFHFSGVNVDKRKVVSKHQNRFAWDDIQPTQSLFEQYFDDLVTAGWAETRTWPYAYDFPPGGLKLVRLIRLLYREKHSDPSIYNEAHDSDYLIGMCNELSSNVEQSADCQITQLMSFVHQVRPDLQTAFCLGTREGRVQYSNWFEQSVGADYQLPEAVFLQTSIREFHRQRWVKQWLEQRSIIAFGKDRISLENIDEPAAIAQIGKGRFVSNLMFLIWLSRKDLQLGFDLRTEQGQDGYVEWFDVSLSSEYGGTPNSLSLSPSGPKILGKSPNGYASLGANLIGYANAELGMGEHVRMSATALSETSVPYGVVNFKVGIISRQQAVLEKGEVIPFNTYKANLFHINADQMFNAFSHLGREFFANRYNIGYWAWELAKCPDQMLPALSLVDEVWAPSRFIQRAFAERTTIPVEYMPLCVSLPPIGNFARSAFKLPEDSYLFLFAFDFYSFIERKNPFASITAFKRAFPDTKQKVGLVIKIMNVDESSPRWQQMLDLIDGDLRIWILNETMAREEVLGLIQVCDCFVSLHRSEGFGRGPAEAMYLGKPVIVTNYSGNTDFTLAENSCLVDYRLVPIPEGHYVFERDQVWAEVDVDHAAWYMRTVFSDQLFAQSIGGHAKNFIRSNFSPAVIGAMYQQRLETLGLV